MLLVWIGVLFVIAWVIGLATVPEAGWYLHLPLVFGGGAILYAVLRRKPTHP